MSQGSLETGRVTSPAAQDLGLVLQVLLLAIVSAALATVLAVVIAPAIPIGVSLSAASFGGLLALAVVVGLVVSIVNVRQATGVDPALAFGRN